MLARLGARRLHGALNVWRLLWSLSALTANFIVECPFITPMLLNQSVALTKFGGLVVPLIDVAHELFELCNLGAALSELLGFVT